jgi:nitronate monooxygenase
MWPDNRILDLFNIELPIIQAPMAGSAFSDMVVAVSEAGGLGSLACALLGVEQARTELETIRRKTSRPINVNFFCHQQPPNEPARELSWRRRLDAYYIQLELENNTAVLSSNRASFDDEMCDLLMEFQPEVVSFHFGLPDRNLLARVRRRARRLFPRRLLWMRRTGLRIRAATQLSPRVTRLVGIGECFSRRMFLHRSAQ